MNKWQMEKYLTIGNKFKYYPIGKGDKKMKEYEEFMNLEDYVSKINYVFCSCGTLEQINIKYQNLKLQINNDSHNLTCNEKYLLIELLSSRKSIAEKIRIEIYEDKQ